MSNTFSFASASRSLLDDYGISSKPLNPPSYDESTKSQKKSTTKSSKKQNPPEQFHLKEKAKNKVVDKAIEGILTMSLPDSKAFKNESEAKINSSADSNSESLQSPDFSLSLIATNIRKLNARAGVLLILPGTLSHILSWHQPSLTLSCLVIYTYACFYPFLIAAGPALLVLLKVLIPGYNERHPASSYSLSKYLHRHIGSDNEQEALEMQELIDLQQKQQESEQRVLVERLKDLQNSLGRLVKGIEKFEDFVYKVGSFRDERKATALYIFLLIFTFGTIILVSLIPTHVNMCFYGWCAFVLNHPQVKPPVKQWLKEYFAKESVIAKAIRILEEEDVIVDFNPEERTVELFELQKVGLTKHQWIPWLFTPVVYDMNSAMRKSQERPPGTRFLNDVASPEGWFFKDDDEWVIDKCTKSWVAQRGIRCVELDTENAWAYDFKDGNRGDWRRRRWTRKCYSNGV